MITNPGTYFEEQPLNPHHHFEYSITEFIGELLNEYEILDIYGQSFVNDHESYYHKVMREARQLNRETTPDQGVRQTEKHELISLKDVKNAQPMYVVALCKKKRTTLNKPQKSQRLSQLPSNSEASKKSSLYKLGANSFLGEGSEIVGGHRISIGDNVMIKKDCWLNIAIQQDHSQPQILIEDGCQIGKNFTISVSNKAHIEKNVLIGANVYIADCGHAYENIAEPIMYQGVSSYTNEVTIGEGTWLGINSVIVGNVRVGKGSIIAANSFVNKDVPDYSVVAGSPAKVIKMFDSVTESWVIVNTEEGVQTILQNRLS